MILFLHGQDTYRSHRKLEDIRAKFLRDVDPSGANIVTIDGFDAEALRAALFAMPFLVKKRLVIAKNTLKSAKKKQQQELADLFAKVPEDTILVIHEAVGAEDLAGNPAHAAVKGTKYYPEFTPLSSREIVGWIRDEAKAREVSFTSEALERYAAQAGSDLWRIATELDKLAAHAQAAGSAIDVEALDAQSELRTESDIFGFLDAVGARRIDRAADLLERLLGQGEAEVLLLNRLQAHVRNLLVCAGLSGAGQVTKEQLVRQLGVHPFVASKTMSQARYFSLDELKQHYAWLIDADARLKTGGWPKPRMALDLFLMRLVK